MELSTPGGRVQAALAGACIGLTMACAGAAAQQEAAPLPMTGLGDGAYVFFGAQQDATPANQGAIANVGFVIGERCVAVIDTGGSRIEGGRLLAAVRAVTDRPVCAVINTHMHPDHVYGNAAFLPERPDFIGHVHLAAALAARSATYARSLERTLGDGAGATPLVPPTRSVDPAAPYELDLGGHSLQVQAWPTAHTDNDVTVFDARSRTLWAGDLLFAGRIPVVDGSLAGWLQVEDRIEQMQPLRVIPGHGPADDWHAALAAQRRYLQALAQDTRAAIRAHRSMIQAVEDVAAGERGKWLLFDEYHRRNIAAAYAELEWED